MIALKAMNSQLRLVVLRMMRFFVLERVIPPLVCKQSVRHVSTTKYCNQSWASVDSVSSNLFFFLCLFNSYYLEKSVHGPGAKPFYKNWQSVHEFSFSPFPLCTSIWLPGKFFMGAFSRTGTNDNLYNLRDWSHHFVFVTVQSSLVWKDVREIQAWNVISCVMVAPMRHILRK